jgi:hypothetical protein
MNQVQPKHICFYSTRCDWSKAFLKEVANTPWKQDFRFVCVDPSPTRPSLPPWLKKVPTLVIQGEPQPRTDGDVMNWLSEMKLKHGGNQQQPGVGAAEPEAFNWAEQTSFAKGFGYSFNDVDTSTGGNGGTSMPGAFSFLNGNAATGDRMSQQMPSMAAVEKRSKKEMLMDKAMEDYMRERDRGMPPVRPPAM